MNNVLQLKGPFHHKPNSAGGGSSNLPIGKSVESSHLRDLSQQLEKILEYWGANNTIQGALVSVYYNTVIAKSNRIKGLLRKGGEDPNDYIRGTKFYGDDPIQHVFTYYVKLDVLQQSIARIETCRKIVTQKYGGKITQKDLALINKDPSKYRIKEIARTSFADVIVDAYYVQKFAIDRANDIDEETSIVTIYKTDVRTNELLGNLGIDMIDAKVIDETTVRLSPAEIKILKTKAPYLIAMKTLDLAEMHPEEGIPCNHVVMQIPHPRQEPTIGVIDTLFHKDVYFKEWVSYSRMFDQNIETTIEDSEHGTEVSSIIVDGPSLNPSLDDGCGRFRVRHFGVATKGKFSSFTVLKFIREIVANNSDIKVWNLSLGAAMQINRNSISPEAAELDRIQCEYDVVFVVAGTNKPKGTSGDLRIGAPADSLNSIVVNAVSFSGNAASYHRVGPVLSFFHKPDVSYYGGDSDVQSQRIKVCGPHGESFVKGTSFAAPWIARKMAYLIHTMGFTREIAKALIIDAAAGWNRRDDVSHSIGYGIVPKRIEDILQTHDDEIRFIMTGSSEAYETYTYNLPIPTVNEKHPFFARATLCYFPKCSRQQGVDYTSTEMDIHFGRITETEEGRPCIKSINKNKQSDEGFILMWEENARKLYRKWDNVKLISDIVTDKARPLKAYNAGMWGLSIKTKERLKVKNGKGLQFGVVVTLKEMNGENRIDDFIKLCMMRGWIVNQIDIDNRFDVYVKSEEELTLDE